MRELIKPCPFCGGKAVLIENPQYDDTYLVECTNIKCGVQTLWRSRDKAIRIWNKRHYRKGKWKIGTVHDGMYEREGLVCSLCGGEYDDEYDYCPSCGAVMRELSIRERMNRRSE